MFFCFLLCAGAFAQNQQIKMAGGKISIAQLFKEIESQTGMSVDYDASKVDLAKSVQMPSGTISIKDVADKILGKAGYSCVISGSHIIVSVKSVKQEGPLKGVVVDANGEPVLGAGVMIKGSSLGTTTGTDGSFTIDAAGDAILEISSIGYKNREIAVGRRSFISITLEEDQLFIEDAVVVGYGVQKKENLTGAVSVVSSKSIQDRSASNLGSILQGTVPGMTVTSASGRPDADVSLNIRGWNSINSGSPLVLVDGVVGSLERVNPNDVESISILKDASSSAVYGAKAAFGVVLVTTKSGSDSEGRAHVRYSGRLGFSSPTTSTDWETRGYYSVFVPNLFMKAFNGQQQITYNDDDMAELWARRNDVVEDPSRPWVMIDQSKGTPTYKYYANTDWWHVFFNDRKPIQNHDLSFRGGSKGVKYFLSANYDREQGIFRMNPDDYKKYNLRARLTFDVSKWMEVSNNTSFYSTTYSYPGIADMDDTFYKCTAGFFSYMVPQNPDGTYVYKTDSGGGGQTILGNLANENFVNKNRTNNFTNTAEITLKPVKQLEIKGNYSYSYNTYSQLNRSVNGVFGSVTPMKTEVIKTGDNEDKLNEQNQAIDLHSVNVFATYTDTFAENHNLKVMGGFQYETYYHKKLYATGYDLYSERLNDQNLVGDASGEKRMETKGGQSDYALKGYFGRINYDYKGKYLLELSGRYDGSSRFPMHHRYGIFPSGSLGWRISEEDFFAPLKGWWNDLKLRASYGSLGNQQVGYYDYIRTVSLSTQSYLFGGDKSPVATFSDPVASDLTWETVQQKNIGLDMAFLDNKITFTGEAYIRDTKDMLTNGDALPSTYGAEAPKTNNADLRTMGYELSVNYRNSFNLLGK
ncbi:MAG: SusC/RagA family TonB-linked outer membrane protein, partial [Bacteroidales bacterium]|nr:SusC/RagA family TonB-linked outer membrane protein [Bacteroidales bacterium]